MQIIERNKIFSFLVVCVLVVACDPGEIPIPKRKLGGANVSQVSLSSNYKYQAYFNLEVNRMVAKNLKVMWDIGFESSEEGFRVILNSSKAMYASYSNTSDFTEEIKISDLNWKNDHPDGNLDSTAIGNWKERSELIIIDRGFDSDGNPIGYTKLRILSVSDTEYKIEFCELERNSGKEFTVPKVKDYNFTHVSFENGGEVEKVEPPKAGWDLSFSQYLHVFHDGPVITPYLTTGVLVNRYNTMVYEDTVIGFDAFTKEDVQDEMFLDNIDEIGYDWKTFDLANNVYHTHSFKNYIIKNSKGLIFKLRFLDFYDSNGEKGTPTFEYNLL